MRPVLVQIGPLSIPSYGVMLVTSFIIAIWFVKRVAKSAKISAIVIENLAFYIMLGVIIGGRVLYVIFHWSFYAHDILGVIRIWEGGHMFFGGFIGAFIAGALYTKKERLSILKLCDIIAPAIALGEFFTRIGCFLNGCCFGRPSSLPWAVKFPPHSIPGASEVGNYTLHPTQLYSSIFGLLLFFFLKRRFFSKHHTGEVFAWYLISYGGFRFGIDFIRYYENTANFAVNQVIALIMILLGGLIFIKSKSR